MNGRVLLLARVQPLGVPRWWVLGVVPFLLLVLLGGVVMREGGFPAHKIENVEGLYAVFAFAACFIALMVSCVPPRPRIGDLGLSLPASQQDWLRAEFLSSLRVALVVFAGAFLGHFLAVLLMGMPAWTLEAGLGAFAASLIGASIQFLLRGRQATTAGWRSAASMLPSLALVSLLIASQKAAIVLVCVAPFAVLAAWAFAPTRLLPALRAKGAGSDASTLAKHSGSPSSRSALSEMRHRLTWRNSGWWTEVVAFSITWSVAFAYPIWPIGAGICTTLTLLARPSIVDERALSFLRHLPFPRRTLFPVIGIKSVVVPAIAIMVLAMWTSSMFSRNDRTLVARPIELIRTMDPKKVPSEVIIPAEHWNIVFDSAPIQVQVPGRESLLVQPRQAFPGVYIWHPYQLPANCSVVTASEQIVRAQRRFHRGESSPAQIAERIVALPDGGGIVRVKDVGIDFSDRSRHYRRPFWSGLADAPLFFLPLVGLLSIVVLRRYRVRQLPARKMGGKLVMGVVAISYAVAGAASYLKSLASEEFAIIAIKAACASVRSVVPSWALFGLCALAVWWLWRSCAKRFDQMEAAPAIPGVVQRTD
jgi:hypothetical protein